MKKSKSSANMKKQKGSKAEGERLIDLMPRKDAKGGGGTTPIKTLACGKHFPTVSI